MNVELLHRLNTGERFPYTKFLRFSSNGMLLAMSDKFFWVWDVATGDLLQRYEFKGIPSISQDFKLIVEAVFINTETNLMLDYINIIEVKNWVIIKKIKINEWMYKDYKNFHISFSKDNQFIVVVNGNNFYVYNILDGFLVSKWSVYRQYVNQITISPPLSNHSLISAGVGCFSEIYRDIPSGEAYFWHIPSGELYAKFLHDVSTSCVAVKFTDDGEYFASGDSGNGYLKLWRTKDGLCTGTIKTGIYSITSVDFSKRDEIVIGGYDTIDPIRIYDFSGNELNRIKTDYRTVKCVAFSRSSNHLAAVSSEGHLDIWKF